MISISHVLGSFFLTLFLSNFSSIKIRTDIKSIGSKLVSTKITTLINFGFSLSG